MDADSSNSDVDISETNAEKLISTATTFLILSWISVALRTYTRAVLMKGLQLDDWLMLLGQVSRLKHALSLSIAWFKG